MFEKLIFKGSALLLTASPMFADGPRDHIPDKLVSSLMLPPPCKANDKPPVAEPVCPSVCEEARDLFFIEAKFSYFHPNDPLLRKIYSNHTGMYGIEGSVDIWKGFYGWVSGSYLSQNGHSIGEHSSTRTRVVPLGLGLKFVYNFEYVGLYAEAGPLYTYFHCRDHSPYVIPSSSKWAWGGIGKIGLLIYPRSVLFLDVFADYSYMKFDFKGGHGKVIRHSVDYSGWSVGGAIGARF